MKGGENEKDGKWPLHISKCNGTERRYDVHSPGVTFLKVPVKHIHVVIRFYARCPLLLFFTCFKRYKLFLPFFALTVEIT